MKKIGYMCQTDYAEHLGVDKYPTKIYTSLEQLKKELTCTDTHEKYHCGIVKVSVEIVETIQEQSF